MPREGLPSPALQVFLACVVWTSVAIGSNPVLSPTLPPDQRTTPAKTLPTPTQNTPLKPPYGVVGHIGPPPSTRMAGGKSVAAWTLDERLASRCNRVKADERVRGEQATAQMRTQSLFAGNPADIISGRSHPELFLPHELFEEVVTGAVFDPGF